MSITDPEWLKAELAKPGRSQAALSRYMGWDASAANRLVNGGRELKAREIADIEEYLRITAPSPLARNVRERMDAIGSNPFRLARDAGVGQDYVRDILRGKVKSPGAGGLSKLARVLETSVADLLGEDSSGPPVDDNPRRRPGGSEETGAARILAGLQEAEQIARCMAMARAYREQAAELIQKAEDIEWLMRQSTTFRITTPAEPQPIDASTR